jgi:TPR repeat protein
LGDLVLTAAIIWAAIAAFRLAQGQAVLTPLELILAYSAYAIFFYSTFITSIWAWAYAAALLLVRILSSNFVARIGNAERPFMWIGTVVFALVFAVVLGGQVVGRYLPEDIGEQLCLAGADGRVCTHEARLTPKQAKELLKKACETGDPAQCNVILRTLGIKETTQNLAQLEVACLQNGDNVACNSAAFVYLHGLGAAADTARAVRLYKRSCGAREKIGCYNLGLIYLNWHLILKSRGLRNSYGNEAYQALVRSCNNQYALACNAVGYIFQYSIFGRQDFSKAFEYYSLACNGLEMRGCANLAYMYDFANGVQKDAYKAKSFYLSACLGGLQIACVILDKNFSP